MELAGPVPELKFGTTPRELDVDPYLSEFTRLGELIFYYTLASPSTDVPPFRDNTPDPDLIIICSWMYAFSKHIAKYTNAYKSRYPRSPILLLRQDGGDFFYRTNAQQMKNLAPAITTIRRLRAEKNNGSERLNVLMHVFSNGGAWTVCQLADAYSHGISASSPHLDIKPELLPISALILDSMPSLPNPSASHTAICEALPKKPPFLRAIGEAAVWCYISFAQNVDFVLGREHLTLNIRRRLNDADSAFMQDGLRRVYIYSQGDTLIPAADVEAHAKDAMGNLGDSENERVILEDFGQTRHVSHMVGDPKRYWSIVDRLWSESIAP
ncbi:hypothetical protein H2200_003456 [Cladophialophora chaetospira]|uniref:Indole-diterpene biosynthesis protein PaxU n=1 Tax=Cladophialophora chaetospira TaxID=386627 RepID=A0AA38XHH6_9EURO|nr:hypothetical protein H2200_003456 [Cladophialophora chaetospira]